MEHIGSDNVTCKSDEGDFPRCDELDFRYLCDESSVKIQLAGNANNMQYHDVNEMRNHIMDIRVETISPSPQIVAICSPSYEDEDGIVSQLDVYGFYSQWYGIANCRIDSEQVGHFHLHVRTMNNGRSMMSDYYRFFTPKGEVATFTLAPAIHSIAPNAGSSAGGTLVTITGRGLSKRYSATEVLVGGEPCDIVSSANTKIVCQTRKPTPSTSNVYPGGAGAIQYVFTPVETGTNSNNFRTFNPSIAKYGRQVSTGWHEYGWRRFGSQYGYDNFWSLLKGTFTPPVTGYYSFISNKDDESQLWMSTNGSNVWDEMESITNGCYGVNPSCTEPTSPKFFFESNKFYAFEHYLREYGGDEYANLGLLYHGSDMTENRVHSPIQDSYETSGQEHHQYEYNTNKLHVVDEKQYMRISGQKRTEKHSIKLVSGDPDIVSFQFRWGNSIGQFRNTATGTFSEHLANDGKPITDLVESQCRTIGSIAAMGTYDWDVPDNPWPYAKTTEEVHCGNGGGQYNYRWLFHHNYRTQQDGGEHKYYQTELDNVPHLCFSYFNVAANAELQIYVGYMRTDGSTTFGDVLDNIAHTWFYFNLYDILTQPDGNEWAHECIDIRTLVRDHIVERGDQHPNFYNDVFIYSLYARKNWGYVDDVTIGVASGDYKIERTVTPHRPNTRVGNIIVREYSGNLVELEYEGTSCNVDIPEMSVVANNIVEEDVMIDAINGKRYTVTEGANNIVIEIWESQLVSPGLVGTFSLNYKGVNTSELDIATTSNSQLETELRQLHGDLSNMEIQQFEGNCQTGYDIRFKWRKGGDYPAIVFNDISITGIGKDFKTEATRHGGVYVKSLPGAYMTQSFDIPQVQIRQAGIMATCTKQNCGFDFTAPGTITSASPSVLNTLQSSGNTVTFSGTALSDIESISFDSYKCTTSNPECTIIPVSDDSFQSEF